MENQPPKLEKVVFALKFWIWIWYSSSRALNVLVIMCLYCWHFSSAGIYLTFKVTGDVPVTHVAANTDSTVPSPAVVTISCNQCFSLNKWITSGKVLAVSVTHHTEIFISMSIAAPPGWDSISRSFRPRNFVGFSGQLVESYGVARHCESKEPCQERITRNLQLR